MFQEWKQSSELQAKEHQKVVMNTLQSFADNLTAVQEFEKESAVVFTVRDTKDLLAYNSHRFQSSLLVTTVK